MRVVVVGAGGLGSYVGAVLSRAGHDVILVTRGDHRTMIEAEGLRVRSHGGDFVAHPSCVASALELDGADLAFLTTKTFSLDEVTPQLAHLAGGGGAYVVSLLNGVTARERLVAHGIPEHQVADGVAYMTAFRVEAGVVERRAAHQRIVMGEDAAASVVEETFRETIVEIQTVGDVRVALWEKMAVVCSLSVLCALGEHDMGSVRGHPFGADLQTAAIAEVLAVGRAQGVPIAQDAEARIDETLDRFPDDFFPSVIHDLNLGRTTEMNDLGGAISRMGRTHGIPTPLHDAGTMVVQLAEVRRGPRPL